MKKIAGYLLCTIFIINVAFGQWAGYMNPGESELDGGLGMTWIDDQAYYSISFQPDIGIGKLGIGLNLNLLYNTDTGKLRTGDWDEGADYARIIRYLRWGHKGDNLYARVGALDAARVGHGLIMNFYNNQINYDQRKLGLALDVDTGFWGFESMTNNLDRLQVVGGRAYIRPMYNSAVPVLKKLGVGFSYVTDVNLRDAQGAEDDVAIWGLDLDLPLIKNRLLYTLLYADHAKIQDFGSGQAVGIRTDINVLRNVLDLSVNFERRWQGKEFVANYFGPMYEVMRMTSVSELTDFYQTLGGDPEAVPEDLIGIDMPVAQKALLPMMTEKQVGWYGALYLDFLRLLRVMGSYQRIDDATNSGQLHFGGALSEKIPLFTVEASYDKIGIETFEDIRTLDNHSVARVGIGYKVKPYLLIYMDYIWNFVWDDALSQFKPQERIQPRLALRYPFQF